MGAQKHFKEIAERWGDCERIAAVASEYESLGRAAVNDMRVQLLRLSAMDATEIGHIRLKLRVLSYFVADNDWNLEADLANSIERDLERLKPHLKLKTRSKKRFRLTREMRSETKRGAQDMWHETTSVG